MTLLEELLKEQYEKKRRERQGQPGTSQVGVVALYAFCQNGDRTPLAAALRICKENGWFQPFQYVDWRIPSDKEPSMYKHCMADVSERLIQVLVTYHFSPELEAFGQEFGCRVIEASA